jgi:lysozyme
MIKGCDISRYQGKIDFGRMADALDFVVMRACVGLNEDVNFDVNWQGAKDAGLARGAYIYFLASIDPIKQADKVFSLAGDGELPICLDLEYRDSDGAANKPDSKYLDKVVAFMDSLYLRCATPPAIYSRYTFILQYLLMPSQTTFPERYANWWSLGNYRFWVAQYSNDKRIRLPAPIVPLPWFDWWMWQFSADGNRAGKAFGVSSTSLDLDIMRDEMNYRNLSKTLYDYEKASYPAYETVLPVSVN